MFLIGQRYKRWFNVKSIEILVAICLDMKFPLTLGLSVSLSAKRDLVHLDIPRTKAESSKIRISLSRDMVLIPNGK